MENVWKRFDGVAKPEEVMEAKSGFDPILPGVYEMAIEELKPSTSKNGRPMLKGRFRLVEDNRVLFYNQVLQVIGHDWLTNRNIAEVQVLIEGILEEEFEYTGLADLADVIEDIPVGTVHKFQVEYDNNDEEHSFPILSIAKDIDEPIEEHDEDEGEDIPY